MFDTKHIFLFISNISSELKSKKTLTNINFVKTICSCQTICIVNFILLSIYWYVKCACTYESGIPTVILKKYFFNSVKYIYYLHSELIKFKIEKLIPK